jgi:MADS-box transcription factor
LYTEEDEDAVAMGRRKISIQPITDERNRKVTFVKRKAGLFKKAHELAVLCQVDLAVIILGKNHTKFYEYTSVEIGDLLENFKNDDVGHDVKTPEDYGDYKLMSRVGQIAGDSHKRSESAVSADIMSSDDDEDEDEDEEEMQKPVKKRRTTPKRSTQSEKDGDVLLPVQAQNPQISMPRDPSQQEQVSMSRAQQLGHQPLTVHPLYEGNYPHFEESQQRMIPQAWGHPPQQNTVETVPASKVQYHYQYPVPDNFVPRHHQLQQPLQAIPSQQLQQQQQQQVQQPLPPPQQPQQGEQHLVGGSSPYTRARSLNNNISKRPILRVEIPTDLRRTEKDSDSAMTVPADNVKDGIKNEEKTPPEDEPKGLGILSNGSTPVSATLPSGLFNLPPPHPTQLNNKLGEQTPLTGGLPSRYVPDLFPSPSNFYSNEWNIPFGSGSTPFPTSANHSLPQRVRRHFNQDIADSPLQGVRDSKRDRDDLKKEGDEKED